MNKSQMNTIQALETEFNAKDIRVIDENLQGEPILYMRCKDSSKIREFVIEKRGGYHATATYDANIQISALMANSPCPEVSK
jgi:hypothetical protein